MGWVRLVLSLFLSFLAFAFGIWCYCPLLGKWCWRLKYGKGMDEGLGMGFDRCFVLRKE